nr:flagellar hook capping FlgD N-terminal domain-containing protein [uncultured Desulfobulbus sp.]
MTTISSVSSSTSSSSSTSASQALGQDQFLTLLVAQLQNQDPLNPADATEFTSQLAQYSQLEQLFNLNDAMDNLTTATTKSQSISALNLIGQDVVVEGDAVQFSGDPVELGYRVDGSITNLNLYITNNSGKTVATLTADDISAGNHFMSWDGTNSNGEAVSAGTYYLTLEATGTDSSATLTPLTRTAVTGVDLSGSEPEVVTDSGSYGLSLIYGAYNGEGSLTNDE